MIYICRKEMTFIKHALLLVLFVIEVNLDEQLCNVQDSDNALALRIIEKTVIINEFADDIFANIDELIIQQGADPHRLQDKVAQVPLNAASLHLKNGWLHNLRTIYRDGNVTLGYNSSTRKLNVYVSVQFRQDLLATYEYQTKVALFSFNGDITGKFTDLKANVALSLDFTNYRISMDVFNITNTRKLQLTFSGNDNVDWMVNLMAKAVSAVFHSIIMEAVESAITLEITQYIDTLNAQISNIMFNNNIKMLTESFIHFLNQILEKLIF